MILPARAIFIINDGECLFGIPDAICGYYLGKMICDTQTILGACIF
jgi:hypothetical protein